MPKSEHRLSKSRFTSGLQCHKKLWWEVHEPGAVELQPNKVLQDLFDQGRLGHDTRSKERYAWRRRVGRVNLTPR